MIKTGQRYVGPSGMEIVVTKGGEGELSDGSTPLYLKGEEIDSDPKDIDETAIDTFELYTQDGEKAVDTVLEHPFCEDMGRIDSAANFVETLEGRAEPLNTPEQALHLMTIIDAIYESSNTGSAISL